MTTSPQDPVTPDHDQDADPPHDTPPPEVHGAGDGAADDGSGHDQDADPAHPAADPA